jgi:hypothetical protein
MNNASPNPLSRLCRRVAKRLIPEWMRHRIAVQLHGYDTYRRLWLAYEHETGRRLSWLTMARDYPVWMASQRSGRSPIGDRVPWIVYGAFRYLRGKLAPGDKVFEYGAGGSTLYFLDQGCELSTAEHDDTWLERVRAVIPRHARWTCHLEPPQEARDTGGVVGAYRSALPEYAGKTFERYVRSVASYPDGTFRAIFVDGRARSDALRESAPKVAAGGMIVLDNAERPRYRQAIDDLVAHGWTVTRFAGAGPYVTHECYETCVFTRDPGGSGS